MALRALLPRGPGHRGAMVSSSLANSRSIASTRSNSSRASHARLRRAIVVARSTPACARRAIASFALAAIDEGFPPPTGE